MFFRVLLVGFSLFRLDAARAPLELIYSILALNNAIYSCLYINISIYKLTLIKLKDWPYNLFIIIIKYN